MSKLSDNEIRAMVTQRFSDAYADHQEVQKQRERAQDFYYGRPLGNEISGRSQVVSKDLMDTVEWLMPSLMRIFTMKNAAQFDPVGPEDEEAAKQETEYVNHVFWKQNDGFHILYSWLKDGLMQKSGYVMYWWEEKEEVCIEEYTGLTQEQATLTIQELEQTGDVEIIGAEIGHTAPGVPQYIDMKLKVTSNHGRLRVEATPPDEVVVSGDCRGSVKKAKFAGRIRKITRSELMEMGFSRAEVDEVADFTWSETAVSQARDSDNKVDEPDEGIDWATREMLVLDCFTNIDTDDDGYAELRHLLIHGKGILTNEDADEIQLSSWSPIITPHKHIGVDMFDLCEDQQRINTGLKRSLLDNTYFGNNQRIAYDENKVNVAMLQINRPGGHVAVDGPPSDSLMPIVVPDIGPRLLPVIQHFDEVRQRRTGVGDMSTGVDAEVLSQSTKGAYMDARGAANQRIEAVARVFAETGLSDLWLSMHRMLLKHQDWPTKIKLRGQWAEVNPAEWKERANMTVSVGLGTAGKEEVRANLGQMAMAQEKAAAVPGLIQPKNVYALFKRMQAEMGLEGEDFITDPASPEYQQFIQAQSQTGPDPYIEGEKLKAQTRLQEAQIESHDKALDRAQERDLTITELEVGSGVDLAKAGIGAEVAIARGNRPQGPTGNGAAEQRPAQ